MERCASQTNTLTERPLQEVIEEAAKEAADEVRDRNKRMGWPFIVSEPNATTATFPESASSSTSSKRAKPR